MSLAQYKQFQNILNMTVKVKTAGSSSLVCGSMNADDDNDDDKDDDNDDNDDKDDEKDDDNDAKERNQNGQNGSGSIFSSSSTPSASYSSSSSPSSSTAPPATLVPFLRLSGVVSSAKRNPRASSPSDAGRDLPQIPTNLDSKPNSHGN